MWVEQCLLKEKIDGATYSYEYDLQDGKEVEVMSAHKSAKSLKRDGIFMLLFTLVILAVGIEQSRGFIFTAPTLKSTVLEFIVYMIINAWWVIDSKKWIADERRRKFIWSYILFGVVILLGIGLLTKIGQLVAASVLVYVLACYFASGIWQLMSYI